MHPFVGRLIVNFVLALICFIAYSSQIFIIWPWYGSVLSVPLITLLVPFNVLVGLLLWNYFLSVVTDPGQVPDSWRPDTREEGLEVKKLTGQPRFCRMCKKYKPPRAHHCRQCDRCVLRMDHHCPWINNCVGFSNYGHFIRFLFYVDLACSYHLAMITTRVYDTMGKSYWDEPSGLELVFILLNYVTCVPVLLAVGAFSLYHFLNVTRNTTTIEGWEKDKVATMVRRGKIRDIKFPYNLGRRRNIESVLGTNPWLWCCPTTASGNGLKYQLSEGEGGEQHAWPPRDPSAVEYQENTGLFTLPSSPWTYDNGLNPDLQAYNSQIRGTNPPKRRSPVQRRKRGAVSSLPPYHPDYQASAEASSSHYSSDTDSDNYSEDGEQHESNRPVRLGSDGYEVRAVDREEMLRQYIQSQAQDVGRYTVYTPSPPSDTDSEDVPIIPPVRS